MIATKTATATATRAATRVTTMIATGDAKATSTRVATVIETGDPTGTSTCSATMTVTIGKHSVYHDDNKIGEASFTWAEVKEALHSIKVDLVSRNTGLRDGEDGGKTTGTGRRKGGARELHNLLFNMNYDRGGKEHGKESSK